MAGQLRCVKCGTTIDTPRHCDEPMHIERVAGKEKLVCHMGAACGETEIPAHCGAPMREAN